MTEKVGRPRVDNTREMIKAEKALQRREAKNRAKRLRKEKKSS